MSLNFYDYPVPDCKAPVEEILLVLHKYGIPTVMTKEVFRSVEEKQKMFDEYQASLINNIDICGEENFEFFKNLCREKLNIQE